MFRSAASACVHSAHWCPPCRGFTPVLAKKFQAHAAECGIAVVFISSDRDQASFDAYFKEMPWLALPFSDKARRAGLGKKYDVRGIPSLIVLDATGKLVTSDGRGTVDKYFRAEASAGGEKRCAIL